MTIPPPTTWTIHLAARKPGRAAMAVCIIVLALAAIAALQVPPLIIALAALCLFGSIAEFLLPITYTLDEYGAHVRHLGSRRILPWERVRRVYLEPDGIKLSPLVTRGWAESYRGVKLRTPKREEMLAQVRAWLEARNVSAEIVEEG